MSDAAATNFARGAELQSSLMARVVQSNIAQQQAEQQRAMLPLRLQAMEVENEMNRLQITAQGYKNQVDAAKVSDQEALAGGLAALASGRDPGQLALKTPEANSAWLNAKAHSAVGRTLATVTDNFVSRISAKGLPPDLVSKALSYPKGPDGTIAPEAWKTLSSAEEIARQQAATEKAAADKAASNIRMGEDKARIELQNEGRLDAVVSRALLTAGGKASTPNSAADKAAFGVKKASFLRQVDVIKADQGLTSSQKIARIEEMQAKFEAEVAAMGATPGSDSAPAAATPPPTAAAAVDPSVRDEIEVNNGVIRTLLTTKADLVSKIASGDSGKTLGLGGGYKAKLDETQKQIDALRAQNARLSSGAAVPAELPTAATGIVVKADGTVVRGGSVVSKPQQPAAPSAVATPPAQATPTAGAAKPPVEANLPADHLAVKDPVAAAFWTVVADKLGVQPESVGFTRLQKAPRSVAKDDPRVKKYYESLPDETKQAIIDEAMKRARENPKDFMPDFFDYFLAPR